jgi:PAS domain S-box-containing protein
VVRQSRLIHYPASTLGLFPGDIGIGHLRAVSYLGAPLLDVKGSVLGHLAVLDVKPLPLDSRLEALFQIFAARATAELRRLRAESQIRESEEKLSLLFNTAMDAIIELDGSLTVSRANDAALATFRSACDRMVGSDFRGFLAKESAGKLERLAAELDSHPGSGPSMWVPGGLTACRVDGANFPAEASLSRFEIRRRTFYTLILRNTQVQIEADRRIASLANESEYLREEIEELLNTREIIGRSPPMTALLESIRQVASTDATVIVLGETGTGKELVARAIHAASRRARKPLIKVNCAAIPSSLMECEFFGHERGAFTGATQRREGRFALAHGGSIFLDEIGDLPLELQAKLLRALQEGEYEPVGSSQTRRVDVRVIAATNHDLKAAVTNRSFREDLYYRLNVFPITVPPLRERREDIALLAEAFAHRFSRKIGRAIAPLTRDCVARLSAYDWPGNVRELQNVIERAVITARCGQLNLDDLLPRLPHQTGPCERIDQMTKETGLYTACQLRELERSNLIRALEQTGWRVSGPAGAARILGFPPSTVSSRMKALGIRRPR